MALVLIWPFFLSTASNADLFDVTAAADARVLTFFPDSNEGNGALLSVYNNPGNIQRTYLVFDLSSMAGLTATGDGILTLRATGDANNFVSDGQIFLAGGSWDESLITWNNQPGSIGIALDSVSGTFLEEVTWTVPQAVIQGWLDNPLSNNGIAIVSGNGSTLTFQSTENPLLISPPRLIFNAAIPEPTASFLLGGVCVIVCFRRNRLTKSAVV
jgi:hypothetical protein